MPAYEFVIQNSKTGLYYRGTSRGGSDDWSTDPREGFDGAFRYSENGAYLKILRFPVMFRDCKVVKV